MNYEVLYIFGQISTYLLTPYFINKTVSSHITAHNNIYLNVFRKHIVLKTAHRVLYRCIYLRIQIDQEMSVYTVCLQMVIRYAFNHTSLSMGVSRKRIIILRRQNFTTLKKISTRLRLVTLALYNKQLQSYGVYALFTS